MPFPDDSDLNHINITAEKLQQLSGYADAANLNVVAALWNLNDYARSQGSPEDLIQFRDEMVSLFDLVQDDTLVIKADLLDEIQSKLARFINKNLPIEDSVSCALAHAVSDYVGIVSEINTLTSAAAASSLSLASMLEAISMKYLPFTGAVSVADLAGVATNKPFIEQLSVHDQSSCQVSVERSDLVSVGDFALFSAGKGVADGVLTMEETTRAIHSIRTSLVAMRDAAAVALAKSFSSVAPVSDRVVTSVAPVYSDHISLKDRSNQQAQLLKRDRVSIGDDILLSTSARHDQLIDLNDGHHFRGEKGHKTEVSLSDAAGVSLSTLYSSSIAVQDYATTMTGASASTLLAFGAEVDAHYLVPRAFVDPLFLLANQQMNEVSKGIETLITLDTPPSVEFEMSGVQSELNVEHERISEISTKHEDTVPLSELCYVQGVIYFVDPILLDNDRSVFMERQHSTTMSLSDDHNFQFTTSFSGGIQVDDGYTAEFNKPANEVVLLQEELIIRRRMQRLHFDFAPVPDQCAVQVEIPRFETILLDDHYSVMPKSEKFSELLLSDGAVFVGGKGIDDPCSLPSVVNPMRVHLPSLDQPVLFDDDSAVFGSTVKSSKVQVSDAAALSFHASTSSQFGFDRTLSMVGEKGVSVTMGFDHLLNPMYVIPAPLDLDFGFAHGSEFVVNTGLSDTPRMIDHAALHTSVDVGGEGYDSIQFQDQSEAVGSVHMAHQFGFHSRIQSHWLRLLEINDEFGFGFDLGSQSIRLKGYHFAEELLLPADVAVSGTGDGLPPASNLSLNERHTTAIQSRFNDPVRFSHLVAFLKTTAIEFEESLSLSDSASLLHSSPKTEMLRFPSTVAITAAGDSADQAERFSRLGFSESANARFLTHFGDRLGFQHKVTITRKSGLDVFDELLISDHAGLSVGRSCSSSFVMADHAAIWAPGRYGFIEVTTQELFDKFTFANDVGVMRAPMGFDSIGFSSDFSYIKRPSYPLRSSVPFTSSMAHSISMHIEDSFGFASELAFGLITSTDDISRDINDLLLDFKSLVATSAVHCETDNLEFNQKINLFRVKSLKIRDSLYLSNSLNDRILSNAIDTVNHASSLSLALATSLRDEVPMAHKFLQNTHYFSDLLEFAFEQDVLRKRGTEDGFGFGDHLDFLRGRDIKVDLVVFESDLSARSSTGLSSGLDLSDAMNAVFISESENDIPISLSDDAQIKVDSRADSAIQLGCDIEIQVVRMIALQDAVALSDQFDIAVDGEAGGKLLNQMLFNSKMFN